MLQMPGKTLTLFIAGLSKQPMTPEPATKIKEPTCWKMTADTETRIQLDSI